MRQKRAKTYRKLLATYIRHFGLRPPLQILIDAPMALALASMKMSNEDVSPRLEAVLQVSAALPSGATRPQASSTYGPGQGTWRANKAALVKPMITQCCITELYNQQKESEAASRAVELAKTWERRFCNHKSPIPGDRCVAEMVGEANKFRYVLAANSHGLRARIRRTVAGVAMIHSNDHHVLVLEPMSDLTKAKCEELERKKLNAAGLQNKGRAPETTEEGASSEAVAVADVREAPPRKRRVKGPNPLSVKKAKDASKGKSRSTINGGAGQKAVLEASSGRSGAARRKRKKAREQAPQSTV